MECENNGCIIGLVYHVDDRELVTLDRLIEHIQHQKDYNRWIDEDKHLKTMGLKTKEYSLKDYADRRKATDFRRFEYCPDCGKKIDWTAIKKRG